jgi:hypothetical protein
MSDLAIVDERFAASLQSLLDVLNALEHDWNGCKVVLNAIGLAHRARREYIRVDGRERFVCPPPTTNHNSLLPNCRLVPPSFPP